MIYRLYSIMNGKKAVWCLQHASSFEEAIQFAFGCPACDDPNCDGVIEHIDWIDGKPVIRGMIVEYDEV